MGILFSNLKLRDGSNIFHMTEQQIIERIRDTSDERVLANELQRNRATQDYLNVVLEGGRDATADYLDSSSLFLPEDFVKEMKQVISSTSQRIEERLVQLKRIEAAIAQQLEKCALAPQSLSQSLSVPARVVRRVMFMMLVVLVALVPGRFGSSGQR